MKQIRALTKAGKRRQREEEKTVWIRLVHWITIQKEQGRVPDYVEASAELFNIRNEVRRARELFGSRNDVQLRALRKRFVLAATKMWKVNQ